MNRLKLTDFFILLAIVLFIVGIGLCNFYLGVKHGRKMAEKECEMSNYGSLPLHPCRDYQIDLHMDTVWIYDNNRLVGSYISNWSNQMDTFLLNDNQ